MEDGTDLECLAPHENAQLKVFTASRARHVYPELGSQTASSADAVHFPKNPVFMLFPLFADKIANV